MEGRKSKIKAKNRLNVRAIPRLYTKRKTTQTNK